MKINSKSFLIIGSALLMTAASSCNNDDDGAQAPKTEMTVMSFNIRYNKSSDAYPWAVRREPVAAMIADINPDVIGLQEPDAGQFEDLKEDCPAYDYVTIPTGDNITWAQTASTMIAYKRDRFSVVKQGYFWQSATPDEPSLSWAGTDGKYHTTVWAQLRDNKSGKDFYVFTAQQSANNGATDKEARLNASKLNLKKMQEIAGRHNVVFFMGDMNASGASSDDRKECIDLYYEWMWGARDKAPVTDTKFSFNSFGSRALTVKDNLDHIFYRLVTPLEFRTIDDATPYGIDYLSRHNPIVFTLEY